MNMKKFSLKPLGDSCIQRLCKSWFFIGLIMAFCVSACGDDDDNTVTPKFPEKQNIVCNAGETKEFTFEANTNWSLTSSAIWCKFEKDGMDEFILSGEAGKQTVTITVTDDDQKVDNISVAKLELTMGGQTIVVGEVTRSAVGYELKIYDEAGNEIQELEVGYDTYVPFKVKANFRFAATNLPSWVALQGDAMVGPVNQEVTGGLKIVQDGNCEKYPVAASDANVITFADESGNAFFTYKVTYKGMTPGKLEMTRPATNQYDWTVSLDGKSFAQDGNANTYTNRLPFTIKTLNDDYEIVFIEKGMYNSSLYLMNPEVDEWMHCERNKGEVGVKVEPLDPSTGIKERVGYVLALSRAEYESIKDDLEGTLIDGEDITYKYQQSALLVQFTQKEIKKDETKQYFSAVDGTDYVTPIECTPYSEGDAEYFKTKYGVKGISEIKQPGAASTYVTVSFEIWDAKCYFLDNGGDAPADIIGPAGTTMSIDTKKAEGKDIFVIVSGETPEDKAMLIVRTSNVSGGGETGGEETSVFKISSSNGMGGDFTCTPYSDSFGGAQYFKDTYEVTDIFEMKNPKAGINIGFTSSNVVSYESYRISSTAEEKFTSADMEIMEDWFSGKNVLNVWLGEGNSLPASPDSMFFVITGEDGSKHMLFIINE